MVAISRKKVEQMARASAMTSAMIESIDRLCEKYNIEPHDHLAVMYGGPGWAHYHEDARQSRFSRISDVLKAARKAQAATKSAEYSVQVRIALVSPNRWRAVRLYRVP